jgi:hypothetical protein
MYTWYLEGMDWGYSDEPPRVPLFTTRELARKAAEQAFLGGYTYDGVLDRAELEESFARGELREENFLAWADDELLVLFEDNTYLEAAYYMAELDVIA